jgi:hypothetical protein
MVEPRLLFTCANEGAETIYLRSSTRVNMRVFKLDVLKSQRLPGSVFFNCVGFRPMDSLGIHGKAMNRMAAK